MLLVLKVNAVPYWL